MPITLIDSFPKEKREARKDGSAILHIAENFMDTIQGENMVGVPSTFLRLQGCTLNCVWCDTAEVWRQGNPYSVDEILDIWDQTGLLFKFEEGQHLILTGGSPLKQQDALIELITKVKEISPKTIVEIENECVLMPKQEMIDLVDIWNNSPKLKNSGMNELVRYKPEVLTKVSGLENSYFKFVITSEEDWQEIKNDFLDPGCIKKEQIVLMPEGQTREELQKHYDIAVNIAVRENVRFTDRLHVTIWNKKTGV